MTTMNFAPFRGRVVAARFPSFIDLPCPDLSWGPLSDDTRFLGVWERAGVNALAQFRFTFPDQPGVMRWEETDGASGLVSLELYRALPDRFESFLSQRSWLRSIYASCADTTIPDDVIKQARLAVLRDNAAAIEAADRAALVDGVLPLGRWVARFYRGRLESHADVRQFGGWWDWFCRDASLVSRTAALAPKLAALARSPMIDVSLRVSLKNCCPLRGKLYDQIQLVDDAGDVVWTIIPSSGHDVKKGVSEVWTSKNNPNAALAVTGKWADVLRFFGLSVRGRVVGGAS